MGKIIPTQSKDMAWCELRYLTKIIILQKFIGGIGCSLLHPGRSIMAKKYWRSGTVIGSPARIISDRRDIGIIIWIQIAGRGIASIIRGVVMIIGLLLVLTPSLLDVIDNNNRLWLIIRLRRLGDRCGLGFCLARTIGLTHGTLGACMMDGQDAQSSLHFF